MPGVSMLAHNPRAAVSGALGALIFIIPAAPGPLTALGGEGPGDHQAMAVQAPASTRVIRSSGLLATSCIAAGWCTAGGYYEAAGRPIEPMIATQSRGQWSPSIPLLLPAGAAAQPYAQVSGIACHSAGNCVAVGDYQYGKSNNLQAFIATESHGKWARAFTPRLPPNASSPVSAQLEAVTCARDGSCTAVGSYQDSAGNVQTMALARTASGSWRQATEIPAPASAAGNPDAAMTGVACSAPGTCAAVGNYSVSPTRFEAMGAVESRGTWHRATQIALPPGAIVSTFTAITSISCLPAGQCLGVGQYAVSATQSRAMAVTEAKGRFGRAVAITAVPRGGSPHPSTYLQGVSCLASGICLAVGGGRNMAGHSVALYMVRSPGHWQAAFLPSPPGATTGKMELSTLYSVSCTGRAYCSAAGYFHDRFGVPHAEVADTQ